MKRYVVRRLLMAVPLLIAISFVCFMFINLIPSNPAEVALRVQQMPVITEEAIAEMEEMLGLDQPFFLRYFNWLAGCLRGDFGISYVNPARTVAGELIRCLPATRSAGRYLLCHRAGLEHPHWIFLRCLQGRLV